MTVIPHFVLFLKYRMKGVHCLNIQTPIIYDIAKYKTILVVPSGYYCFHLLQIRDSFICVVYYIAKILHL